jgi:hypothetical protein
VDLETFKFVGPANREGGAASAPRTTPAPAAPSAPVAEPAEAEGTPEGDDVPF